MDAIKERRARRRFLAVAGAIVLLAFSLRAFYVQMAVIEFPIRGDINQYVLYAWNLAHRGVFSTALPEAPTAVPDSYRGPGYPALLAATMLAAGKSDLPLRPGPSGTTALGYDTDKWMRLALGIQVLLGAATAGLAIAVARLWLSRNWALVTGLIVAGWPHLITFSGVLLSETLLAFLLLLSFWALCRAQERNSSALSTAAGLAWGATYFVNPIVGLFPPLVAVVWARRSGWRQAAVFVSCFALLPAAWMWRNAVAVHDGGAQRRVQENFVQGSWPQFFLALNNRDYPVARQVLNDVRVETQRLEEDPRSGLNMMLQRMSQAPGDYALWYLVDKPYLLWDWTLRIGWSDIYFLPTEHSLFDRVPVLAAMKRCYAWANPLVFWLAAVAALVLPIVAWRRIRPVPFAALALCALIVYLTLVHDVLQAEPRYSIPYRPEQILLAITALACLCGWSIARARRLLATGKAATGPSEAISETSI